MMAIRVDILLYNIHRKVNALFNDAKGEENGSC